MSTRLIIIVSAVVALLLALLVGCGLWREESRLRAEQAARVAKAGAVVAAGGERASQAAVEAVASLGEKEVAVAATDRENRDAILSKLDAKVDAGAAGDAGLRGLCRRPVYRDHPRCAGLRQPGSAPASR